MYKILHIPTAAVVCESEDFYLPSWAKLDYENEKRFQNFTSRFYPITTLNETYALDYLKSYATYDINNTRDAVTLFKTAGDFEVKLYEFEIIKHV